ncbi:hypothetical protein PsorP6_009021 [Peronosclerospora sorghi]|uniref:Uncharacterized protein n=1 Tax=Peronosclerospora sorghi TaxID=230839 RepID=A0ACC0W149_9STRA|nr:hypothetical protein PsorP6_009021 [Peronosclerospora sorghi]
MSTKYRNMLRASRFTSAFLSFSTRLFPEPFVLYLFLLLVFFALQSKAAPLYLERDSNPDHLWSLDMTRIAEESAQFRIQVLQNVPDLVPIEVKCDKIQRCDHKGVCAIVCKHGSVQMAPWLRRALKLQRKLAYRRNFCSVALPATHNSAINLADGYGVEDHVFEGYLRYFRWFKKGMRVQTNNQLFSLTDQLHMGARLIELDVHWFDGDLRIAHCGGFRSKLLDGMIEVFNIIAKSLGTDIEWDSETIGCKPSLSSIPTKEQRPLSEALSEIATWLHAPENADEFLMVFFDDETNLMKWEKVGILLDYLKKYFPEEEILRPIELAYETKWPTLEELLRVGKRILFMSGADYLTQGEEILFVKDTICNWQELALPLVPFPACRFNRSDISIPDNNFTIFRPETSEIVYAFLNANGEIGSNKHLLNEDSLPKVVDCGVNLPSPDNITPKRMEATIWAVPKEYNFDVNKCVVLTRKSKTWESVDCKAANMVAACAHIENPRLWQLGNASVVESDATSACAALKSYEYSVPASGYENELLYSTLIQQAPSSIVGVWLNARKIVSEVYSMNQDVALVAQQ